MKRSYLIALLAMLNLQKHLAVIRCSTVFVELHRVYADGPKLVAACALLYGRQYGLWEAGVIDRIEQPDPARIAAEVKDKPELREKLDELRECAYESVRHVAEAVQESIGIGVGVEALSQWEEFGKFCRRCLGVEPMVLLRAYELVREDPAAEVLAIYPNTVVDEAIAEHWAGNWAREWGRRFTAV